MGNAFVERACGELRRGVLQVAVLGLLREPTYGYDLLRVLADAGMPTEEGTLYPVLRRLQKEKLLAAEWDTSGSRPRKYYQTSDRGREVLGTLVDEWSRVRAALLCALGDDDARHAELRPRDDEQGVA